MKLQPGSWKRESETGGDRGLRVSRFVPVFLLATAVAGCVPATHIPLSVEKFAQIESTRVHAVVAQEEISARVEASNVTQGVAAAGGGLLPLLIASAVDASVESKRMKAANQLIEPVRTAVGDFDFRAQFFDRLRGTVGTLKQVKAKRVDTGAAPLAEKDRKALARQVPEGALLTLSTGYELSPKFRSLSLVTTAELSLRAEDKPVYLGKYEYWSPPVSSCNAPEDCAKDWSANHGAPLRAALQEGIADTMKMLRLDLTSPGMAAGAMGSTTPNLAAGPDASRQSFPGYVSKDGNRYIVRRADGNLCSASSDQVFIVATSVASN